MDSLDYFGEVSIKITHSKLQIPYNTECDFYGVSIFNTTGDPIFADEYLTTDRLLLECLMDKCVNLNITWPNLYYILEDFVQECC